MLEQGRVCGSSAHDAMLRIGSLHDAVTWYGINYAGTQITQWDFQNKRKSGWTGKERQRITDFLHFTQVNHSHPICGFTIAKIMTSLDT